MNKIRFGVIGCGLMARGSHLPNLSRIEEATLEACCDLSEENLAQCAPFHPRKLSRDFHEVIADPEVDALLVATTERFRVPIIEAAAAARKPVYVEKPMADTLENAYRIEQLVRESGIPFCVGHNRRCSPAMMEAHEIFTSHMRDPQPVKWRFVREGIEAVQMEGNTGAPVVVIRVNDDWKSWKPVHLESELNQKVGLVLSEGTHFVDLANWFIDDEPVSVYCTGYGVLNHTIVIKYAKGGMATITAAASGSFGYPKELFEAIGNSGVVAVDHMTEVRTGGIAGAPAIKRYPLLLNHDNHPEIGAEGGLHGWLLKRRAACEDAAEKGDPMLQFSAEADKGHLQMHREFIREIRGERGPVCPASSALQATRTCLAAARSLIEERVVLLDEVR